MENTNLATEIERAVQRALDTNNFSELNKNISNAVNTSIAQIGTTQNRFYQQYENDEMTMEQLEHVDGEIVGDDPRADFNARRRAAQAEQEQARYNSRRAQEARRLEAEERRRAAEARRREEASRNQETRGQETRGQHQWFSGTGQARQNGGFGRQARQNSGSRYRYRQPQPDYRQNSDAVQGQARRSPADIVPISRNPAGRVSGILLTIFGAIGLFGCFMMFLLFNIFDGMGVMPQHVFDVLMGSLFGPTLVASSCMFYVGTKRRHRIQRFYQYVRQLRGRTYCSIKELSSHVGRSKRFVLKDVRKMISLGMFPEGHIDDQETCVMLNGATYDQYLKAQNSYLARQLEKKQAAEAGRSASSYSTDSLTQNAMGGSAAQNGAGSFSAQNGMGDLSAQNGDGDFTAQSNTDGSSAQNGTGTAAASKSGGSGSYSENKTRDRRSLPPKVIQVLSAGDSYLTQIREANAAIPGELISAKLDRLEQVIQKIYARIEVHPEQVEDLNKFITYYLPTTLKLVNAYRDFDRQTVQGDNIQSAKKEIESTLDTIIYAFETLLDSLYEDDALDISTDISVLQTMFAQEGLTKGAFDTAGSKTYTGPRTSADPQEANSSG